MSPKRLEPSNYCYNHVSLIVGLTYMYFYMNYHVRLHIVRRSLKAMMRNDCLSVRLSVANVDS